MNIEHSPGGQKYKDWKQLVWLCPKVTKSVIVILQDAVCTFGQSLS